MLNIIFLSAELPVDSDVLPLTDILDFTDRSVPGLSERVRHDSECLMELAREGVDRTYALQVPEHVLQHWRATHTHNRGLRPVEYMRELLEIEHRDWKPVRIGIPTALQFFCSLIRVQASNFVVDFLDRSKPRNGAPLRSDPTDIMDAFLEDYDVTNRPA